MFAVRTTRTVQQGATESTTDSHMEILTLAVAPGTKLQPAP